MFLKKKKNVYIVTATVLKSSFEMGNLLLLRYISFGSQKVIGIECGTFLLYFTGENWHRIIIFPAIIFWKQSKHLNTFQIQKDK